MSEQELFLKQIVDHPRDLDSRLVYADWCCENGLSHGELIQTQFELAGDCKPKRRRELKTLEKKLIGEMVRSDPLIKRRVFRNPEFHLGFIERATITLRTFIDHGAEICAHHPIRFLELMSGQNRVADLAACEHLKNIEGVDFRSVDFEDAEVVTFAESPHLNSLKKLRIRSSRFAEPSARAIAENLDGLESIHFTNNFNWDDACMRHICSSKKMKELNSIVLENPNITFETCERIANSTFRKNLEHLQLDLCPLGDAGVEKLLAARGGFPSLKSLILSDCLLEAESIKSLEQSRKKLPKLELLGLNFNELKDEGAIQLSKSVILKQLKDVRMSQNEIALDGLMAIGASTHRDKKTKFYLAKNKIRGGKLSHLIKAHGNFGKFDA